MPPRVRAIRTPSRTNRPNLDHLTDAQLLDALRRRGSLPSGTVGSPSAAPGLATAEGIAVPTSGKSPTLKFPDPEVYSGDPESLDAFLLQAAMYLRACRVDLGTDRSVAIISMFLRGKAKEWFANRHALTLSGVLPPLADWHAFVSALTDAVRPVELKRKYYADLLNLKQGKLDIRSYITAFNALRSKTAVVLPDDLLCYLFVKGLRPAFQQTIVMLFLVLVREGVWPIR